MAIAELSKISKVLKALIEEAVFDFGVVSDSEEAPEILEIGPPDKIPKEKTLSLYLYHVREDAAARNMPSPVNPNLGTAYSPLGLRLYYQLTAHPEDIDEYSGHVEDIFGGALKAFHDYPILTPNTKVGASEAELFSSLNDVELSVERLELSMLNIPVEEASNYWVGGSEPRRLCAHVEVGVVFLEAEEPTSMEMPVLEHNVFVDAGFGVSLEGSSSEFVLKDIPNRPDQKIEFSPARPAVGERFTLRGQGWGGGPVAIRLHDQRRDEPQLLEDAEAREDRRVATLAVMVPEEDSESRPLLPGIYGVTLESGGARSNQAVVVIRPDLALSGGTTDNPFVLTGGPFKDSGADPLELSVQLFIGQKRLILADLEPEDVGELNNGEFWIRNSSEILVKMEELPEAGEYLPIRVVVDDVESLPIWLEGS